VSPTTTAPPATAPSAPSPPAPPARPVTYGLDPSAYRFSVDQYHRMIQAGILGEDDPVELLEGYLVLKMSRNPAHDATIQFIQRRLYRVLPEKWDLRTQLAISLGESEPEPDFAVVRGEAQNYLTRHPGPADIGVVIEIANTSLQRDLDDKARVYAQAGIAAYWVVNVTDRSVEAFTRPSGPVAQPAYADRRTVRPPDALTLTLDGTAVTLPAADLLP
jgi:Uma2 family endonuclease